MAGHRIRPRALAATAVAAGLLLASTTPAAADGRAIVPLTGVFKRCDFSVSSNVPTTGYAHPVAMIGSGGGQVTADVQFVVGLPDTRYTARLIQVPRPTLTCAATDPGVAAATLDTDSNGSASVTLRAPILRGATGAFVLIDRAGEYTQTPAEHYSSDFLVAV